MGKNAINYARIGWTWNALWGPTIVVRQRGNRPRPTALLSLIPSRRTDAAHGRIGYLEHGLFPSPNRRMILSFGTADNGHEKRSKGNSEEPFANRGCARFARA